MRWLCDRWRTARCAARPIHIRKGHLIYLRTLKFAAVQAKLRARIGRLPGPRTWSDLALHPATDLREGLDGIGVDFWLEGLPDTVSRDALERHFMSRTRALLAAVADRLPDEWEAFSRRLVLAPDVFWVTPVLAGEDPGMRLDADSALQRVARSSPEQRRGLLQDSPFAPYVEAGTEPEEAWRAALAASVPRLPAAERRPVQRLRHALDGYLAGKTAEFQRLADPGPGAVEDGAGTWHHHRALEERLYTLLAGDPFHPALILIHALLELLTMEKLRALLLCRLMNWPPPAALTGKA